MHYSVNVEYQVDDDRAATPNGNESVANWPITSFTASAGSAPRLRKTGHGLFDHRSEGLELQTTLNGSKNDGGTKMGSRCHKISFFNRYNFSTGWFSGSYVGGGYRYQSKMFTGKDPRDNSAVMAPSFWNADPMAGYTLHGLGKGRRLSFQLNIFNLFDHREALITRYQFIGDQKHIFRTVPQAPRNWRFTTNFEFWSGLTESVARERDDGAKTQAAPTARHISARGNAPGIGFDTIRAESPRYFGPSALELLSIRFPGLPAWADI